VSDADTKLAERLVVVSRGLEDSPGSAEGISVNYILTSIAMPLHSHHRSMSLLLPSCVCSTKVVILIFFPLLEMSLILFNVTLFRLYFTLKVA
jgi:hypothetical protein